jgi:putative FmdB family regulatory protein
MPLYMYRCQNGHEQEELRKMDDRESLGACRECGWSNEPIQTTPGLIRFKVEGVKGHYKRTVGELPNA